MQSFAPRCQALADPYFRNLANVEREPSAQPVTKMEFEFERRRITKEDVRELIYREILEYHPKMLKEFLEGTESTGFMYPRYWSSQFSHESAVGISLSTGMTRDQSQASFVVQGLVKYVRACVHEYLLEQKSVFNPRVMHHHDLRVLTFLGLTPEGPHLQVWCLKSLTQQFNFTPFFYHAGPLDTDIHANTHRHSYWNLIFCLCLTPFHLVSQENYRLFRIAFSNSKNPGGRQAALVLVLKFCTHGFQSNASLCVHAQGVWMRTCCCWQITLAYRYVFVYILLGGFE